MSEHAGDVRVAVVGGSIAGLCTSLLLERLGVALRLFEARGPDAWPSGGGLGFDPDLVAAVTGQPPVSLPHVILRERQVLSAGRSSREPVAMPVTVGHLLRRHLASFLGAGVMEAPAEVTGVTLVDGAKAAEVEIGGERREVFDLVLGADGARSRLRDLVVGGASAPEYAGYVQWRGLVPEAALDDETRAVFFEPARLTVAPHPRQLFVAYPVPGPAGEVEAGARRLSWGWFYGATRERVEGLPPALTGSQVPAELVGEAERFASKLWPAPVQAAIRASLEGGAAELRLVYELAAPRLARGCVGLVGDAAHVISPVSGGGVRTAMYDSLLLARLLVDAPDLLSGLAAFEVRRLPVIRALVEQGRSLAWGFRVD